jgi:hypothetical protein
VYVRGLGDRYSLALLNGSPLPSPEPMRRAVPLDLFPTDIVASSLVQKTYSSNYPGEFGGGVINLTTLGIPKTPFLTLGGSVGGDSETTSQTGYDYYGSKSDWTGYDNGNRDTPAALRDFFSSRQRMSAGSVDSTAGPPVLKLNSAPPVSAPFSGFQSGFAFSVQRVPGGSASRKSYSQTRSLAQRPEPARVAPSQATPSGSGSRRSPNGTTASENFTVTWRTCATSPCGLTDVMVAARAGPGAAASTASSANVAAPRARTMDRGMPSPPEVPGG